MQILKKWFSFFSYSFLVLGVKVFRQQNAMNSVVSLEVQFYQLRAARYKSVYRTSMQAYFVNLFYMHTQAKYVLVKL